MRREEPAAFQEFFACFSPLLLREARRLGVQPALRDQVVLECLDDAAMALMQHTTPVPRSLAAYLAAALRHDVFNESRRERRGIAQGERAYRYAAGHQQRVVMETCSESSLRASDGPDWEDVPLCPALERLAAALDAPLTDDERRILTWVGQWVPQTLIAEWLGISYGATRARVLRLRTRLRALATDYMTQAEAADRRLLESFLRRVAGAELDASDSAAAAKADRPLSDVRRRPSARPRAVGSTSANITNQDREGTT